MRRDSKGGAAHSEVSPAFQALLEGPPPGVVLQRRPVLRGLILLPFRSLAVAGPVRMEHLKADRELHPQLRRGIVGVHGRGKGAVHLGRLKLLLPQLCRSECQANLLVSA
jgi:hypothetical protein